MKHLIGCDIDGVMANTLRPLSYLIIKKYGIDVGNCGRYDFWEDPKSLGRLTREKVMACFDEVVSTRSPNGYVPVRACHGARDFVKWIWSTTRVPVHFVTTRSKEIAFPTFRWLEGLCGKVPFTVSMVGNKREVVAASFEWFVEDRLETAVELMMEGVKVIMPIRSYNRHLGESLAPGIFEVHSLYKIPEIVPPVRECAGRVKACNRGPRKVAV